MGQELGIDPRVGHIFPMENLYLPPVAPISIVAAVSFIPSLALWHA